MYPNLLSESPPPSFTYRQVVEFCSQVVWDTMRKFYILSEHTTGAIQHWDLQVRIEICAQCDNRTARGQGGLLDERDEVLGSPLRGTPDAISRFLACLDDEKYNDTLDGLALNF